jgi:hypothetical protein
MHNIQESSTMKLHSIHLALSLALLLTAVGVQAGEGHDHGDAPATSSGPALPRFTAVSETFELVGVLSGKQITLYLDRYADNTPVLNAQIELDVGGIKLIAQAVKDRPADGVFEVALKEDLKAGVLPITATVSAGAETDLLAGEIDIHAAAHADVVVPARSWKARAGWSFGGLTAFILLVFAVRRIGAARRSNALRAGGAA